MLRKVYGQVFETVNVALGFISLTAIAIGAFSTFTGLGLHLITKAGVKTIPEERIESLTTFGMGFCLCGGVGFAGAVVAAASAANFLDAVDKDEEESRTSGNNNCVVFKPSDSVQQEPTDSLYLYQLMNLNGCRTLDGKLIVGRIEDELNRKVIIYDKLDSFDTNMLMEIFDTDCDEDKLIGKAFSSTLSRPRDAARDFIDFHRPQLQFKADFGTDIEKCLGCRNFHGADKVVCGYHPYGWDSSCICPDWQPDKNNQRAYFPYERSEILQRLNQDIEPNRAYLSKNDDGTLTLWDNHTLRRFHFSWAGILLEDSNDSDKLLELGEHARLLSYIQYFAARAVIEFDYSAKIDDESKTVKGYCYY
ncbi:hypothetical protein DSM106972_066890 [Dulcicalothrix desertica PCC 7102]|uniref:Uncharacterized protein n=1 Tax=Dulcicalothrix desertica PCC 7102 TaxID=232991 RepID=A0A433V661_9CYAN|nr:hypothetical protein [Dulcicalothrix desertica]RUT01592.1 hypothetical protein DSM106972_066890 [Dulcicalothrix desertica PCC 7102]